ncbi:hypothetical protein QQF64_007802 [Cirrhinus molitorella]|uniref:Uncharacterized protein n=1 Tax=Cirrhinus molitorella TaxID=172907 RepID=A0ABR3MBS0_9TELE
MTRAARSRNLSTLNKCQWRHISCAGNVSGRATSRPTHLWSSSGELSSEKQGVLVKFLSAEKRLRSPDERKKKWKRGLRERESKETF